MLRVVEYFAWLLKIIENCTIRKLGNGFLFAFHSNCDRIFSHFYAIDESKRQTDTARRHRPRLCIESRENEIGYTAYFHTRVSRFRLRRVVRF